MFDKHIPSTMVYGVYAPALKFVTWNVPDNDGGRFVIFYGIIFILILSVALLAISFFGTLILLSFYTDPPMKFVIVITLVVLEINFVLQE